MTQPPIPAIRMRRGRSSAVDARHARRASASPERPHLAAVHLRRAAAARSRSARCPASAAGASTGSPSAREAPPTLGIPCVALVPQHAGEPAHRRRARGAQPRQSDLPRDQGDQGRGAGDRRADRRRARSLHQPRPGRADRRPRLRPQRRDGRRCWSQQALVQAEAGADIVAPVGHDGRPRRRDPPGAGGRRPPRRRDHGLCRQICLGLLRPVPRRGRLAGPAEGRQARLPDGPGQQRRGAARGRARPRRGRRHGDGQAGPALSRHRRAGEGRVRRADLRLPGVAASMR